LSRIAKLNTNELLEFAQNRSLYLHRICLKIHQIIMKRIFYTRKLRLRCSKNTVFYSVTVRYQWLHVSRRMTS